MESLYHVSWLNSLNLAIFVSFGCFSWWLSCICRNKVYLFCNIHFIFENFICVCCISISTPHFLSFRSSPASWLPLIHDPLLNYYCYKRTHTQTHTKRQRETDKERQRGRKGEREIVECIWYSLYIFVFRGV